MDYKRIGKFLAIRRKDIGLTQKQLAEKLHVTDKAISKWETGKGCPDVSILGELSEALDVGIGEILNGEYSESLKDNNKFILDAVTYSKETTTKKIYKRISYILTIVMLLLSLYLIGIGIYQTIHFNKTNEFYIQEETLEEFKTYREDILQKIDKIMNLKTDIYSDKQHEYYKIGCRIYTQEVEETMNNFKTEHFRLNHYEYGKLYNSIVSLLNLAGAFNHYATLNHELISKEDEIINQLTSIIYKTEDSYSSMIAFEGKLYDMNGYYYSQMRKEYQFDNIITYMKLQFKMMDNNLNKIIETGEFYE